MSTLAERISRYSDYCQQQSLFVWSAVFIVVLFVTGCGGGASTENNPNLGGSTATASSYNGPNALTDDVRAFQVNLWEHLRSANRCGGCHFAAGQSPMFVRDDDVNLAYSDVGSLVTLSDPAASRLVSKVGAGHNCWLTSNAACATAITSYIENWANGTAGGAGRVIQLTPPPLPGPGDLPTSIRALPSDSSAFASNLWPLLKQRCAACHKSDSATPQQPFFASDTESIAYDAAKSKIDLNNVDLSRLVVRLRNEFHNCWTIDCGADASEMQAAIQAMADTIPVDVIDQNLVFSHWLRLIDGVVAAGGSRYEADVIAQYEFKSGSGNVALDTSGVAPELNLTLSGDVNWVGGWGIEIVDGKAQGSTAASKKLSDMIKLTGEYSIEAWVAPGNVVQEGPAGIVSYSAGNDARNFTLGQTQYNYNFLQRSSTTDGNGEPALSTPDADEDLQATLQHVVVTFDPIDGRKIFVNGALTDAVDSTVAGNLNDWDDSFAFVLGNEVSGDRLWKGAIRMVAIHNRALTLDQIQQNFSVGVGEKFFLLFRIGQLIGVPDSYVMFEVSQFDSYSYLFNRPTFINLNPNATIPGAIPLQGMRIGINGKQAAVGQAYANLNTSIDPALYDPVAGQVLMDRGTVIALENGPQIDEFFLTFEVLGGNNNLFVESSPTMPPSLPPPAAVSDIGVRTFDEINATMSAMTGVPITDPAVVNTFETIKQQLPTVENVGGFLSAHQVAITQLAIEYCNALVDDIGLRGMFFGSYGFNEAAFNSSVTAAFPNQAAKDNVVDALYDTMIGFPGQSANSLANVPARIGAGDPNVVGIDEILLDGYTDIDTGQSVESLFDALQSTCGACDAVATRTIVKGMCASVLGSAAMLVQ